MTSYLDKLRRTLNTDSLRRWLREEFPTRWRAFTAAVPIMFEHAMTAPPTYTVVVHNDDGTVEEVQMSEMELRESFGDGAWEEAMRQYENGVTDPYVSMRDLQDQFVNEWQELGVVWPWEDSEEDLPN